MNVIPQSGRPAFDAGVKALEGGNLAAAADLFATAIRADPGHVAAHHYAGGVAFRSERYREALEHFESASRLDPGEVQYRFDAAVAHWKLGDFDAARRSCENALGLSPGFLPAHQMLSTLDLPGPFYFDVLAMVHAHLRPRTYVEIGVADGQSIALALPETRAIGIDPEPKISAPLAPRTRVVAETSDDYFAHHDVRAEMDGLPIDLAFIDGMHQFEYALRDFINIEKRSSPRSTILIHDCYPLNRLTAERERRTLFWSGDVWRLVLLLRKHRPDLSVNVIATAPTGLCVVRRLDPDSRVLQDNYEGIVGEYLALDYAVLDADKAGMLARFPNDWEKIKPLLQ
ncbi:MAG TPA: class I SAM-dependent methyltransferase [Burkholderiales bacterium]|nr:class I SAM-dependent methyltransferase [Burkholderiales bacterium]